MPPKRGRQAKTADVSLTQQAIQMLAEKIGYSHQQLADLIAMGLHPNPVASNSSKSSETITQEDKGTEEKEVVPPPVIVEEEDRQDAVKQTSADKSEKSIPQVCDPIPSEIGVENPKLKPWVEVVKSNRAFENEEELAFVAPGEVVKISESEWEEGGKLWQHAVLVTPVSAKPGFLQMQRWAQIVWKNWEPRMSQVKPGVFLFEFK